MGAYCFTHKHQFTDSIYFFAELLQALFSKVNQFGHAKLQWVTTTYVSAWQEQRTTKTSRGRPTLGRIWNSRFLQTKVNVHFVSWKVPASSKNRGLQQLTITWRFSNASNTKWKPNKITWIPLNFILFHMLLLKAMLDYKYSSELLLQSKTRVRKKCEEFLPWFPLQGPHRQQQ